jgi:hypothetical protein
MKIERIYAIAFIVLFALAVMPFAMAIEDSADAAPAADLITASSDAVIENTELSEEELAPMYNAYGLEMRFLQLEEAILKSVQGQKKIVEYINENYPDEDTADLESIIMKLGEVLGKTQSIDFTVDAEDYISIYHNLKVEAKELVKLFREISHDIIGESESLQLRERVRNIETNETINLSNQIRERKVKYNSEQVMAVFNRVGINNSRLIGAVKAGEANYGEIRSEVAKMLNSLDNEAKKQAILKIREAKTKLEVQKDAIMHRLRNSNITTLKERVRAELSNAGAIGNSASSGNGVNN